MYNWFECKITYEKMIENGLTKKVTETYLLDALSFTEAEERITEEMKPYISGEFKIANMKREKLAELFFNPSGDRYWKAKVNFITLDEKSGAEKKTAVNMLVQASTIQEAIEGIVAGMKGTMSDYVISSIVESPLLDIFPYEPAPKVVKTQTTADSPATLPETGEQESEDE